MERQPNSRICFFCGIDNPMGLDRAQRQGFPEVRWVGLARYWTKQLKVLYSLAFSLYD